MTKGIVFIVVGIFGLFFNTVALIAYNIKMRKKNEMAFITLRGLKEPKTSKLVFRNTITMFEDTNEKSKNHIGDLNKSEKENLKFDFENINIDNINIDNINNKNVEDTVFL